MKAAEFKVVIEAKKAAEVQLSYFNSMLAKKPKKSPDATVRDIKYKK